MQLCICLASIQGDAKLASPMKGSETLIRHSFAQIGPDQPVTPALREIDKSMWVMQCVCLVFQTPVSRK